MKIEKMKIDQFKNISKMEVLFNGESRVFKGSNGAGKTSILQAIEIALTGTVRKSNGKPLQKKHLYKLLPEGATHGEVGLRLLEEGTGKIILLRRRINKTQEKILQCGYEDGSPLPPSFLDNLISDLFLDPLSFCKKTPQEQTKFLGIDTSSIDEQLKRKKDDVKQANALKLSIGKKMKEFEENPPKKVERLSTVDLMQELNTLNEKNRRREEEELEIKGNEKEIEEFFQLKERSEIKLADLLRQVEETRAYIREASLRIEEVTKKTEERKKNLPEIVSTEEVEAKLKSVDEVNAQAQEYEKFIETSKEYSLATQKWEEQKEELKRIENEKNNIYINAQLPTELSIDETGGLQFEGHDIDEVSMNHAKIMSVILALLRQDDSKMKTVLLKDGPLYDKEKTIPLLNKLGYQLIVEEVSNDTPKPQDGVYWLKDCKIVEEEEEKNKETKSLFD